MSRPTTPLQTAVKRAITAAAKRDRSVRGSVDAALALELARQIEGATDEPLAARVTAARVLAEAMARIEATAPIEQATDRLDELSARRTTRRKAAG